MLANVYGLSVKFMIFPLILMILDRCGYLMDFFNIALNENKFHKTRCLLATKIINSMDFINQSLIFCSIEIARNFTNDLSSNVLPKLTLLIPIYSMNVSFMLNLFY